MISLCNDCRNKNCPMQSGINRTSCEFYKAPTKSGYICVKDAIDAMQKQYDLLSDNYHAPHRSGIADCIEIIKDIPAADVRPAVRGKWKHKPGHDGEWLCCVCNHDLEFIDGRTMGMPNFCPNCGAEMRKQEVTI